MGSGYFPLDPIDAKKLEEIKKRLQECISEYYGDIYSGASGGQQFDNAASDGGYLERLNIAVDMIDGCIRRVENKKGA